MPKALEEKLEREASAQGLKGAHRDAYVYGTMRKTGWTPSTQRNKTQTDGAVKALRKRG